MHPRYISSSRGSWEIGLVFSQSGRLANIGSSQMEGAILAIDEINAAGGIDGLPLIPVIRDDTSDPARFLHLSDLLLREEGINIVFGGSSPDVRRAATPLFERRNGLLWYSGLGDGFDFSPSVFCFGLLPNQACGCLLREIGGAGAKDIFILFRDDLLSHGLRDCLAREVERTGCVLLGESLISDQPADVSAAMARVQASNAKKVLLLMSGSDSITTLQALRRHRQGPIIATFAVSEKDLTVLEDESAEGLLTVSTYCSSVTSPVADAFNARFAKRYGRAANPNAFSEASYSAVCLFALSLERSGSVDSDDIRNALLGLSLRGPQGQVVVDAETNCAELWPRVLRWGADRRFEIVAEPDCSLAPDPFLIGHIDLGRF